jgi:hypothetical protein
MIYNGAAYVAADTRIAERTGEFEGGAKKTEGVNDETGEIYRAGTGSTGDLTGAGSPVSS